MRIGRVVCAIVTRIRPRFLATMLATEETTNVANSSCSFNCVVVIGNGHGLHDEWIYSHPSGVGGGVCLDTVNTGPPGHLRGGVNRDLPASGFKLFL